MALAGTNGPYAFYQYWINVDDADASRCLRFLTDLDREQIEALDAARAAIPANVIASDGLPRN